MLFHKSRKGFISLKRNTFCPVDKRCFFSGPGVHNGLDLIDNTIDRSRMYLIDELLMKSPSGMKSEQGLDEICYADEIKSVLASDASRISSRSDFIHRKVDFSRPSGRI